MEQATIELPIEVAVAPVVVPAAPVPNVLSFDIFGYSIDAMAIVFLLLLGLIVLFFVHAHKYETNFNVYDLIMENGHASKTGVLFVLAFIVSSWIVVHQTLTGALSDTAFGAWLAAWVIPIVTRIATGSKDPPSMETPSPSTPASRKRKRDK